MSRIEELSAMDELWAARDTAAVLALLEESDEKTILGFLGELNEGAHEACTLGDAELGRRLIRHCANLENVLYEEGFIG